jgi:hypothetical protein
MENFCKNGLWNRHSVSALPQRDLFGLLGGVFPLVSNHDCTLAMVNSWVIGGDCTPILIRVAPLTPPNANPLRLNSAIPRMTAAPVPISRPSGHSGVQPGPSERLGQEPAKYRITMVAQTNLRSLSDYSKVTRNGGLVPLGD